MAGVHRGKRIRYGQYKPGLKELCLWFFIYVSAALGIGWLFFGSISWGIVFLPGIVLWIRYMKKRQSDLRKKQLAGEFQDALELLALSLKAGYSVESAFKETAKELEKLHGHDADVTQEFLRIRRQLNCQIPIETLLEDFAARSDLEDIRNFSAVFSAAKRLGGDLPGIIRTAADTIGGRIEVEKEIENVLAAKKFEQKIMAVMPCAIILYMRLGSPGFLDVLYESAIGHLVMACALIIYAGAVFWGMQIVRIEV